MIGFVSRLRWYVCIAWQHCAFQSFHLSFAPCRAPSIPNSQFPQHNSSSRSVAWWMSRTDKVGGINICHLTRASFAWDGQPSLMHPLASSSESVPSLLFVLYPFGPTRLFKNLQARIRVPPVSELAARTSRPDASKATREATGCRPWSSGGEVARAPCVPLWPAFD